jgi:Metal-sensitive transcriptional repressor
MPTEPGYITEKQAILTRLRRIEGQIRGLRSVPPSSRRARLGVAGR